MDKNLNFSRPYLVTLKIAYDHYLNLLYRAQLLPNARLHGQIEMGSGMDDCTSSADLADLLLDQTHADDDDDD